MILTKNIMKYMLWETRVGQ